MRSPETDVNTSLAAPVACLALWEFKARSNADDMLNNTDSEDLDWVLVNCLLYIY